MASPKPSPLLKAAVVGVALILVVSIIMIPFTYRQVPEGHEGVTKEWGAVTGETLDSGAHWKTPFAQSVQSVETRPRTYTMSKAQGEGEKSEADAIRVKTVNGSTVDVDLTVRYHIRPDEADQFVSDWNDEKQMEQRLIRPTIRSTLRDEASSLQTTGNGAIYTQEGRAALENTAEEALREEFTGQPIELEAVQIRNIDLPDEIDRTLDEKEQAKQQVEVENEKVKQERARAEQKIVQAEADAESTRIRAEAYENHPVMLQAEYIEALDNGNIFVVPQNSSTPMIMDASNAQFNESSSESDSDVPNSPDN